MRNLIFFLVTTAFILGSHAAVSAQEWIKLAPEAGNFEIMMPGTAKASEQAGTGTLGPYKTYLYIVRTGDTVYLAGYADYLPTAKIDTKAEIRANRDNFMKAWKEGKILSEKEITLGSYPGLEFKAQVDGGRMATSRIIMVGNRPYQLIALTFPDSDQAGVLKFLDSFKVTKK